MVDQYKGIVTRLNNRRKELDKMQSTVDRKITDVLHKIELTSFNASDGYTYARMLKEIQTERRAIKNEYSMVMNAVNALSLDVNDNSNKEYKVRELNNVFGDIIK